MSFSDLGRKLRLGVVGGGPGSFIGPVHRAAALLDGRFEIVAGVLSSNPERSRAAAEAFGFIGYANVADMIAAERLVLLTISPVPVPYIADADRVKIERMTSRFIRIHADFGYMERPRLAPILAQCERDSLDLDKAETSFVYADPLVVAARQDALPRWQRGLFAWLQRNSRSLATELEIPPNRRVELSVEAAV